MSVRDQGLIMTWRRPGGHRQMRRSDALMAHAHCDHADSGNERGLTGAAARRVLRLRPHVQPQNTTPPALVCNAGGTGRGERLEGVQSALNCKPRGLGGGREGKEGREGKKREEGKEGEEGGGRRRRYPSLVALGR
eukprot:3108111-Rhodomonas_salina.1